MFTTKEVPPLKQSFLYIFSRSEERKNSISRFIKYVCLNLEKLKRFEFESNKHAKTYSVIEDITSTLDKEPHETLLNTAVIMDVSDINEDIDSELNPITSSNTTGQIVSSLILAYPEVYWIILGTCYNKPDTKCGWKDEHFVCTTNMMYCASLLERHSDGYRPLFDPSGLRTWLKQKTLKEENSEGLQNDALKENRDIFEKRKVNCAVAIDEELPYTFLNGYTAFRYGYRCYMITTNGEMEKVLGEKSKVKCDISLEDLDLRFSDTPQRENLNDVYLRKEICHKLPCNGKRFIITGFQSKDNYIPDFFEFEFNEGQKAEALRKKIEMDNYGLSLNPSLKTINWLNELLEIKDFYNILLKKKPYLPYYPEFPSEIKNLAKATSDFRKKIKHQEEDEKIIEIKKLNRLLLEKVYPADTPKSWKNQCNFISKPYAGIYGLIDEIAERVPELREKGSKVASNKNLSFLRQLSFLKCYSDKKINDNRNEPRLGNNDNRSHSAPNKILILVDHLLDRTREIISNASSCQESVHAALLALEAKELLHGQSMTTALEALSCQHKMEVKAECSFYGVAHGIKVKARFDEIAKDVDVVVRNNEPSKKLCQSYDAQINILSNFRSVFKYHDQFDEEDQCLNMIRRLRQGLHFLQHQNTPFQKFKSFLRSLCLERYINHLIRSPWNLIFWIFGWILFFSSIYFYINTDHISIIKCFINAASQSLLTFFTVGLTSSTILKGSNWLIFVTITEIIIAYFHLGIFVAYIYQKISRR